MSDEQEHIDPEVLEAKLREQWNVQIPPASVALTPINDNPTPETKEINNRSEYIDHYTRQFNSAKDNKLGMASRRILFQAPLMLTSLSTLFSLSGNTSLTQSTVSVGVVSTISILGLGLNHAFDTHNAKTAQQMDDVDQKLTEAKKHPEKTFFEPNEFLDEQQLKRRAEQTYKNRRGKHTLIESRATVIAFTTLALAAIINAVVMSSGNDNNVQEIAPTTHYTTDEPSGPN